MQTLINTIVVLSVAAFLIWFFLLPKR